MRFTIGFRSLKVGSAATLTAIVGGGASRFSSATSNSESKRKTYDCLIIGGGSGGIAFAKRAASYGQTVAIVEGKKYGGKSKRIQFLSRSRT